MQKKIAVAVLFGGKSAEHDISLQSARNIVAALDPQKYEVSLLGIDRQGHWLSTRDSQKLLSITASPRVHKKEPTLRTERLSELTQRGSIADAIDVVFPVLHGSNGEDGTMQGFLRLVNIPFVGADVLGSAVGMDKDIMKRLLRDAKIPVAPFLVATRTHTVPFAHAKQKFGLPLFVKPANLGSSVGVSKVHSEREYEKAVESAFSFDTKLLIEKHIQGREIEVSVLGNEKPIASVPGEVIPNHAFYSYEAKYLDENGARIEIPARLSKALSHKVRKTALLAYTTLSCEGMGRVDVFVTSRGKVYVNEINTIPGFTDISMYPKLWAASGLTTPRLLDRLIELAIERHKKCGSLVHSRTLR